MFNERNDNQPGKPPRSPLQGGFPNRLTLFVLLALAVVFITHIYRANSSPVREISYSDFNRHLQLNQIESVTINDNTTLEIVLRGQQQDTLRLRTRIPYMDPGLLQSLSEQNVNVYGASSR